MQHGMATKCACGSFRSGKLLHALLCVYFLENMAICCRKECYSAIVLLGFLP